MRISDWSSDVCSSDLLASGAAHELGTPLSTLSVLIGDWKAAARLKDDPELHDDLADMDAAVQRCKTIVSGILMRSEEHTSELQSLMRISYAVFCLTKKKRCNTKLHCIEYEVIN